MIVASSEMKKTLVQNIATMEVYVPAKDQDTFLYVTAFQVGADHVVKIDLHAMAFVSMEEHAKCNQTPVSSQFACKLNTCNKKHPIFQLFNLGVHIYKLLHQSLDHVISTTHACVLPKTVVCLKVQLSLLGTIKIF